MLSCNSVSHRAIRIYRSYSISGRSYTLSADSSAESAESSFLRPLKDPPRRTSKWKMISDRERVQSYKCLEKTAIAHILSSPPRMLHVARIVIPRDFLVPLRVMENPIRGEASVFPYIIAPYHPDDLKVPEDPVLYYANSISLFESYNNKETTGTHTVPLQKLTIYNNMYPNIKVHKHVGWNIDTHKVIEQIYVDLLKHELEKCEVFEELMPSSVSCLDLVYIDSKEYLFMGEERMQLNLFTMLQHSPEIIESLKGKFKTNIIPINSSTDNLNRILIRYSMFLNN